MAPASSAAQTLTAMLAQAADAARFSLRLKSPDHPVRRGIGRLARGLTLALKRGGARRKRWPHPAQPRRRGRCAVQRDLIDPTDEITNGHRPRATPKGWQAWITYHRLLPRAPTSWPAVTRGLGHSLFALSKSSSRAQTSSDRSWASFAPSRRGRSDAADVNFLSDPPGMRNAARDQTPEPNALSICARFLGAEALHRPRAGRPMLGVACCAGGQARLLPNHRRHAAAGLPVTLAFGHRRADGPPAAEFATLMAPLATRSGFLGPARAPAGWHRPINRPRSCSGPVWNEAFGLAYRGAGRGSARRGQDRPGVRDVSGPCRLSRAFFFFPQGGGKKRGSAAGHPDSQRAADDAMAPAHRSTAARPLSPASICVLPSRRRPCWRGWPGNGGVHP